jgi:hypothetical protein
MHRFWNPEDIPSRELAPGVIAKIASGEKVMLSLVTLAPNAVVPEHSHPHEQMGMGVSHKAVAGPQGAMTLEAFSPPREEFR